MNRKHSELCLLLTVGVSMLLLWTGILFNAFLVANIILAVAKNEPNPSAALMGLFFSAAPIFLGSVLVCWILSDRGTDFRKRTRRFLVGSVVIGGLPFVVVMLVGTVGSFVFYFRHN